MSKRGHTSRSPSTQPKGWKPSVNPADELMTSKPYVNQVHRQGSTTSMRSNGSGAGIRPMTETIPEGDDAAEEGLSARDWPHGRDRPSKPTTYLDGRDQYYPTNREPRYPAQDRDIPVLHLQEHLMAATIGKIHIIIYYDCNGKVQAVGAEAMREGIYEQTEDGQWVKAEWFKPEHPRLQPEPLAPWISWQDTKERARRAQHLPPVDGDRDLRHTTVDIEERPFQLTNTEYPTYCPRLPSSSTNSLQRQRMAVRDKVEIQDWRRMAPDLDILALVEAVEAVEMEATTKAEEAEIRVQEAVELHADVLQGAHTALQQQRAVVDEAVHLVLLNS
ncbi:hypothetical protein BJ912DRAFT_932253 [Pholiota molesta]|nr:hypothetical protein BJ912DRAFT_932253 [Pholiota molesta]